MKIKEITLCLVLCILLVVGGGLGLKYTYNLFFDPSFVIENAPREDNSWIVNKEKFEKSILYPCIDIDKTADVLPYDLSKAELYLSPYISADVAPLRYSSETTKGILYNLAGSTYSKNRIQDEKGYEFSPSAKEYSDLGLEVVLFFMEDNSELISVIGQDGCPLMVQHRNYINEYDDLKVEYSSLDTDMLPDSLFQYLSIIDDVLGVVPEYRKLIINLQTEDLSSGEQDAGSLGYFAHLGEWFVYSDTNISTYVCVVGKYSFSVFFDNSINAYCGYNLIQGNL